MATRTIVFLASYIPHIALDEPTNGVTRVLASVTHFPLVHNPHTTALEDRSYTEPSGSKVLTTNTSR